MSFTHPKRVEDEDMNRIIAIAGLAAALALPVLGAPVQAHASCSDRKAAGTVLGGVGGALIGNSISGGGGGALLGGLGGAVLGHEVARSGCRRERREAYYYRGAPRYRPTAYGPPPLAPRYVYYDRYGNPVAPGPVAGPPAGPIAQNSAGPGPCPTWMQSYYDSRGALVQRPVQVCAR
jgi:hypothetical protein